MAWVVVAVLAVAVTVMFSLYKRAMSDSMAANALLTMCLLDDGVAKGQRDGLALTIDQSPATNPHALAKAVDAYFGDLAYRMLKETTIFAAVPDMLWARKKGAA